MVVFGMYDKRDRWQGAGVAGTIESEGCGDERVQMAISSYLDGEADPTERAIAEWHLAECHACKMLLAGWSADSGRLRQTAHDAEIERITREIADQTRYWLAQQWQPAPVYRESETMQLWTRKRQPSRALGVAMAAMLALVAILGVSLSTMFSASELRAEPTRSDMNLSGTLAFNNMTAQKQLQTNAAATPSIARVKQNSVYTNATVLRQTNHTETDNQLAATPLVNQPSNVLGVTPSVIQPQKRS
jgi:hypothetical protein